MRRDIRLRRSLTVLGKIRSLFLQAIKSPHKAGIIEFIIVIITLYTVDVCTTQLKQIIFIVIIIA